jgi:hypothetical protein
MYMPAELPSDVAVQASAALTVAESAAAASASLNRVWITRRGVGRNTRPLLSASTCCRRCFSRLRGE